MASASFSSSTSFSRSSAPCDAFIELGGKPNTNFWHFITSNMQRHATIFFREHNADIRANSEFVSPHG